MRGAREHFDAARERDEYLRPAKKLLVELVISKSAVAHALETVNELFVLLKARGHSVVLAPAHQELRRHAVDLREQGGKPRDYPTFWSPWRPTVVFIGTVAIGLTLYELSEEVEVRYVNGKYVPVAELAATRHGRHAETWSWTTRREIPSGRLCLQAYSPYGRTDWARQWCEVNPGELGGKLKTIARELEAAAPTIANLVGEGERQAEIERQQWEARREEWRREEAERRRVEALKASREELAAIIERWAEARRIEAFFADAEARAAQLGDTEAAALRERLQRARDLLGGVDALERFRAWKAPEER